MSEYAKEIHLTLQGAIVTTLDTPIQSTPAHTGGRKQQVVSLEFSNKLFLEY